VNWEHLSDKLITVLNKDVQGNIKVSHISQLVFNKDEQGDLLAAHFRFLSTMMT